MSRPTGLKCVRCAKAFPLTAYRRGCDACLAQGVAANLTVAYAPVPLARDRVPSLADPRAPRSMWRWDALLPASASEAVTLGEGNSPLVPVERLGLGPLWLKDESRSPTWSFKDRLAGSAVTMAKKLGAKVIASSSTGNAGAATAAYAARAGLPCVILTYDGAAGPLVTQMRAYGAMLLSVPASPDRWKVLSAAVERYDWFPTTVYFGPAAGSNPLGIEGYKTLSYEIAEAMDWDVPDWCALPVCYGDAIYGMWKGFEEMRALGWTKRTPRFLAAEVSGSFEQAMAEGTDALPVRERGQATVATSIGSVQGTYQGLAALRASDGRALFVSDEQMMAWSDKLARIEGVYAEPSAAATLPAIERLRAEGTIKADDKVVALFTAGGLKDTAATERSLGPVPRVAGDLDAAVKALKDGYGFRVE